MVDGTFLLSKVIKHRFDPNQYTYLMKRILQLSAISFFLIFLVPLYGQEINQTKTDANGREILLGKIDKIGLTSGTFDGWFTPQYKAYTVNPDPLNKIAPVLNKYTIVAFMGTWCGDSKREVPRFYKLLEAVDFPMQQFTLIAVDNSRDNYKRSPNGEEKGLNIHKVPTFILYKNGEEVNRIIESPIASLEEDILNIVTSNTYLPNYAGVVKK